MEKVLNVVVWSLVVLIVLFIVGAPLAFIGVKLAGYESIVTGNMDAVRIVAFTWFIVTLFFAGAASQD